MRAPWPNAIAITVGAGSGVMLLAAVSGYFVTPGSPSTVLPAGATEIIPGYQHANSTSLGCSTQCGSPGEIWLHFWIAFHGRLWGVLHFSAPVEIWVGNSAGMASACALANPPPPCAQPVGPAYIFKSQGLMISVDFGAIEFDFESSSVLPAGSWSILLINWSELPIRATAESAVTVHPTW